MFSFNRSRASSVSTYMDVARFLNDVAAERSVTQSQEQAWDVHLKGDGIRLDSRGSPTCNV